MDARYSKVAAALHWAIAGFIIANWPLGFIMEAVPAARRGFLVSMHASFGMTVLVLTLVRIAWRLTHRPPPFEPGMALWEKAAAHTAHFLLYAAMLFMPITGWSILSAHPPRPGAGPVMWGLFHLPPVPPVAHMAHAAQKLAHDRFVDMHLAAGWILLAVFVLHVAGALKHQFVDGQRELQRMWVGR